MGTIKIEDLESIAATRAKIFFGDLIHQVSVNGKRFIIKRQRKPVAVIVSYNEYCELISEKKPNR